MKNGLKKALSLLLAMIFIAMSVPIFAETDDDLSDLPDEYIVEQESFSVKNSKGMLVRVDMEENALGRLTLGEIRILTDSVKDKTGKITVHDVGESKPSPAISRLFNIFDLRLDPVSSASEEAADFFITSAAKGQAMPAPKFSARYDLELAEPFGAAGGVDFFVRLQLGLQTSFSTSFTTDPEVRFTGPEEDSPCNSRIFRVKFYRRYRDFSITLKGESLTGHFWEPTHCVLYSIDIYVS